MSGCAWNMGGYNRHTGVKVNVGCRYPGRHMVVLEAGGGRWVARLCGHHLRCWKRGHPRNRFLLNDERLPMELVERLNREHVYEMLATIRKHYANT